MANRARSTTILVVGLGRFGFALAQQLHDDGQEVMGIDADPALVDAAVPYLTYAETADATSEATLRQLGVHELQHAVVAIGDAIQASILATATLSDLEVPDIWAKAQNEQHKTILERVGAHHVVFPEGDMGRRIAHRISGSVLDYIEIDDDFVLVETRVPARYVGRTLAESHIREDYSVTVVCHQPAGGQFHHTDAATVLAADDLILVAGRKGHAERFAGLD